MNLEGLPYFFGISLFIFEGNALALEINHQTDSPDEVFMPALQFAISITCGLVVVLGSLSYAAYGQYT
jgi:F0F1-type ATP synthase membrane subunit a